MQPRLHQSVCGPSRKHAENPRYIETVSRLGYRFVAPVREADAATPQSLDSVAARDAATEVEHDSPWRTRRSALN
jgi:DNA-binding winged helix-turn-helix (wHTH) protein